MALEKEKKKKKQTFKKSLWVQRVRKIKEEEKKKKSMDDRISGWNKLELVSETAE